MCKIVIADDQEIYRAGIAKVLTGDNHFQVAAQFSDWNSLLAALPGHRDSIVIASSRLLVQIDQLVSRARESLSAVLLVAEDSEPLYRYHSSGVAGIVHRSTPVVVFLDNIRGIRPGFHRGVDAGPAHGRDTLGMRAAGRLTPSEMRIVAQLMNGIKNREIARRLGMAEQMVRTQMQRIFDKTGVSNRLELALFTAHNQEFGIAVASAGRTVAA